MQVLLKEKKLKHNPNKPHHTILQMANSMIMMNTTVVEQQNKEEAERLLLKETHEMEIQKEMKKAMENAGFKSKVEFDMAMNQYMERLVIPDECMMDRKDDYLAEKADAARQDR